MQSLSHILVVAEPAELDDAMKVLGKLRCRIDILSDGRAAWSLFLEWAKDFALPELIILELRLPNCDGLTILRHLRAEKLTKDIPVVVLTNSAIERHVLENFDLGPHTSVVKPLSYAKLMYALLAVGISVQDGVLYRKYPNIIDRGGLPIDN